MDCKLKVLAWCKLENDFHRLETQGQTNCYCFKAITWFVPKANQPHASLTIGPHFMHVMTRAEKKNFSNSNGLAPTNTNSSWTKPQHHVELKSCTYDQHGIFIPSTRSIGIQEESEFISLQKEVNAISMAFTTAYISWLKVNHVEMQIVFQCDLYDCRSTQFVKSKCGKSWAFERTMTRKLARELEQGMGGPTFQHKGVRWRPQRKHPWVVEIRLKKRKLWISDFDSFEEAVQAYDVAAIEYGITPLPKLKDSSLRQAKLSYAAFNDCIVQGRIVQAQPLPMYHASKSPVNHGVEVNDGVDLSTSILHGEEFPTFDMHQDSQKIGSNIGINNLEMENTMISSYHMFASDLPGMPFVSNTIHGTGATKSITQNIVRSSIDPSSSRIG